MYELWRVPEYSFRVGDAVLRLLETALGTGEAPMAIERSVGQVVRMGGGWCAGPGCGGPQVCDRRRCLASAGT